MEKNSWLTFLSAKIKSQIALEASEKAQNWALTIFGFLALGFALGALAPAGNNPPLVYGAKVLFLIFFHIYAVTQFFIPGILQKGQKPIGKQLQLRDFVSLVSVSTLMAAYLLITAFLSWQAAAGNLDVQPSGFLAFSAWLNVIFCAAYAAGTLFYIAGLFAFPGVIAKTAEKGSWGVPVGLGAHAGILILTVMAYSGIVKIGSPEFFEQLRIAGLFWVFIGATILLTGRVLRESAVPALSNLEIDLISGRLERMELVVPRFKDAFISSRFDSWLKRYAKDVALKASEIAKYTKEALVLVNVEKPSELDLRQVETRYHKAESLYKSLDKNNQRVSASMAAFFLTEVETEKAGLLHDQFSRELRNAKLELASMRKRIDERLVSLKNAVPRLNAPIPDAPTLEELTLKS